MTVTLFRRFVVFTVCCWSDIHVEVTVFVIHPHTAVKERHDVRQTVGERGHGPRAPVRIRSPVMESVRSTALEGVL